MKNKVLVSIIIPVYNVEDYLHACIQSVLSQTYHNFEMILVDDGSTDKSGQICDDYKNKFPNNIIVVHKTNGGLSDARNVGISLAKGEYLAFIDSDDYICPNMIEVLLNHIIRTQGELAVCKFVDVTKDNEFPRTVSEKIEILSGDDLIHLIYSSKYPKLDFVSWNKLYKKELFTLHNIKYPVGKYHEDEYTTHKILHLCNKIIITNQELYCYRIRENSIVNTPSSKKTMDFLEALEETMLAYKDNDKLAASSLFRYMIMLYVKRKNYGFKSKERFLIDKKMKQYIQLVVKQKHICFKRKWGLVAIVTLARLELIIMNYKYK